MWEISTVAMGNEEEGEVVDESYTAEYLEVNPEASAPPSTRSVASRHHQPGPAIVSPGRFWKGA
jgi:hypothetical protein